VINQFLHSIDVIKEPMAAVGPQHFRAPWWRRGPILSALHGCCRLRQHAENPNERSDQAEAQPGGSLPTPYGDFCRMSLPEVLAGAHTGVVLAGFIINA